MLKFDCEYVYESGFALVAKFETSSQVTGLCGPSGSGKTTILNLIAGLAIPKRGSIQLGSSILTDTTTKTIVRPERRSVGMMFQEPRLFPHLNVNSNIRYGIKKNLPNAISVDQVIETLELEELLTRYPRSLSGGQQQRVALARAIATSPQILLLDEPLTSVEHELRNRISTFIARVVSDFQIPTILVSHDLDYVSQMSERVVHIESGKIVDSDRLQSKHGVNATNA